MKIRRIVGNKPFYDYVAQIKILPKIKTDVRKIDLKLIDSLLDKRPIVYIDAYTLFGVYHAPHFVTVLGKIGNKYSIFDTWDGEEKLIDCMALAHGISSLRNHIKLCPQILIVE